MTDTYLQHLSDDVRNRARRVRLLGLDVDGTLSNGQLGYLDDGREIKSFSVLDGMGMKLLRDSGIEVALISARASAVVAHRARELGLQHIYLGSHDKLESLGHVCGALGIGLAEAAFMGDDLPDLPALGAAGLAVAPANAHPWVRARVHWCTQRSGGEGAVRELCDAILTAQDKVDAILRRYQPQ